MAAKVAKGKAKVSYVLPEKLIERIGHMALRKKTRPSYMVESLLKLGLEREPKAPKAASQPSN